MQRVLCNAIVDVDQPPAKDGKGLGKYRVEVWGKSPADYVRIYKIQAKDENTAARQGIDMFVDEIAKLLENNN